MAYDSLLRRAYFSELDVHKFTRTSSSRHISPVFFGILVIFAVIEVGTHEATTLFTNLTPFSSSYPYLPG